MSTSGPIRHAKEELLISKGPWVEPFKENTLKENPLKMKRGIHVKENPFRENPLKTAL